MTWRLNRVAIFLMPVLAALSLNCFAQESSEFFSCDRHKTSSVGVLSHVNSSLKNFSYPMVYDLTVVGPMNLADGIGRQSAELVKCLENDCTISYIPSGQYSGFHLNSLDLKTQKVFRDSGFVHPGKVLIFENMLDFPPRDQPYPGPFWQRCKIDPLNEKQVRFAYSMFESSRLPYGWVSRLNENFDAVLVPDPYLVDVYKQSGVKLPVFVLPLGLDLTDFHNFPMKEKPNKPMVFANFGTCLPRKNHVTLLRAFYQAFGDSPDVVLHLGWRAADSRSTSELLNEIAKYHLHNVRVDRGSLNRNKYLERFRKVDCYVSLSKGEGFSIQPREALAAGIPTIVTNSTAQRTICSSGCVLVVPADIKPPATYSFSGVYGHYEDCTVEDAANALREMYKNYNTYLKIAQRGRSWVSSCSYDHLRPYYLSVVKPKKILLGSKNEITENGIITTSQPFANKFAKLLGLQVKNT